MLERYLTVLVYALWFLPVFTGTMLGLNWQDPEARALFYFPFVASVLGTGMSVLIPRVAHGMTGHIIAYVEDRVFDASDSRPRLIPKDEKPEE